MKKRRIPFYGDSLRQSGRIRSFFMPVCVISSTISQMNTLQSYPGLALFSDYKSDIPFVPLQWIEPFTGVDGTVHQSTMICSLECNGLDARQIMRGVWLDKALLNASLHINVCWLWAEVLLDKEEKKLAFVMRGKSMRDPVKGYERSREKYERCGTLKSSLII